MNTRTYMLLLVVLIMGSCTQNSITAESEAVQVNADTIRNVASTPSSAVVEAEDRTVGITDDSSIESDIQFIRDKYAIISQATDYRTVPFETQCDERSLTRLERRYNKNGELSYLKYEECGEHGCSTKHHYYWNEQLIFIFHKYDYTPGSSHVVEEHRTYFKDGKMIRCLEKEVYYREGQAPMAELLAKAPNKEVDCTPEKRTPNLAEIETLSLEEAQQYFCSPSFQ